MSTSNVPVFIGIAIFLVALVLALTLAYVRKDRIAHCLSIGQTTASQDECCPDCCPDGATGENQKQEGSDGS